MRPLPGHRLGTLRTWATAAAVALGLALLQAPAAPAAADAACPALATGESDALDLGSWTQVGDGPLCEAEFTTDALYTPRGPGAPEIDPVREPVRVRVLLPDDYDPAGSYDVLYLLNGGAGDYTQWSTGDGDVVRSVTDAGYHGIVVMPEGGKAGFYADWAGYTYGNFAPLWETFHIHQLLPWIDDHLATSGRRAVAGMSMGGFGALKYAAQHPGLFDAVGSFSGGTDLRRTDHQGTVGLATTAYGARFWWHGSGTDAGNYWKYLLPGNPTPSQRTELVFGPQSTWASFNPAQVAETSPATYGSYGGKLLLYSGRAEDPYAWNTALDGDLTAGGVPHRYCTGPGGHDFATWTPALKHFLRFLSGATNPVCPAGTGWQQES